MIVGRVERFGESGVCVVCVCVCVVGVCGCVEREEESGVWCQVDTKGRLLVEPEFLLKFFGFLSKSFQILLIPFNSY